MKLETLDRCNICNSKKIKSIDHDNYICKCQCCGYVFDNPRPTSDEIARYYSRPNKYSNWLLEEQARDSCWKRRLKKMRKNRKNGTLLDIGTGIGQFLHHAKGDYTQVYGTEISESAVYIAKNKYNLDIIKGDIKEIQFKEASTFDTITLFHVLEHVENPKVLIEKCWSLLVHDGILVLAVPNDFLSLNSLILRIKARVKHLITKISKKKYKSICKVGLPKISFEGSFNEIHVSHFTAKVLKQLLENNGFFLKEHSLDMCYVSKGLKLILDRLYYVFSSCLFFTLQINIYDTIWMVAKKKSITQTLFDKK